MKLSAILKVVFFGILLLFIQLYFKTLYRARHPTPEHIAFQNYLKTKYFMGDIENRLIEYKREYGSFPSAESNLVARLIEGGNPIEKCPHSDAHFLDPFGNSIDYQYDGTNATLASPGPDQRIGSEDDIRLRVEIGFL